MLHARRHDDVQLAHYNATYWLTTARNLEICTVMGESVTPLGAINRLRALVVHVRAGVFKEPRSIDTKKKEIDKSRHSFPKNKPAHFLYQKNLPLFRFSGLFLRSL